MKFLSSIRAEIWPVLLLLMVVVLVPTACVLWFMNLAMRNERLAIRQQLEDVYRGQLLGAQHELDQHWTELLREAEDLSKDAAPSKAFESIVTRRLADSAIVYDLQGAIAYPTAISVGMDVELPESWRKAAELEFIDANYLLAAQVYAALAREANDINIAARALQAQVRSLVRAGRSDAAITLITDEFAKDKYKNATDQQGRLIAADARLMALRLMEKSRDARLEASAESLQRLISAYDDSRLPASQRHFLMNELTPLLPEAASFPTLKAESIAARVVDTVDAPSDKNGSSALAQVWQVWTPNRRVLLLFNRDTLLARLQKELSSAHRQQDVRLTVLPPDYETDERLQYTVAAGSELPDWQLVLEPIENAVEAAANERAAYYLWTGMIFIAAISVIATLLAWLLGRQIRVTRLKNDLVATVSHELKTPLASMRLLVDTLLNGHRPDEARTREYLELIAGENNRLSRLIDNFLAFSRLERKKYALDMATVSPAEVVHDAIDAAGERMSSPGCRLNLEIEPNLPELDADHDALVTALLNLMDNAYKYTGDDKQIRVSAYGAAGAVCFAVADNGVGVSSRAAKRVFQKFYQVDRSLTRTAGGCGLGLSIVQFIATAHGGSISVQSQPGQGSTFTLRVPAPRSSLPLPSAESRTEIAAT